MSRKRKSLALLAIMLAMLVLMIAILRQTLMQNTVATKDDDRQPQNDITDGPKGPVLVVPESPLGTIALFTAFVTGFVTFASVQKRR
jgi:hypothetical protein